MKTSPDTAARCALVNGTALVALAAIHLTHGSFDDELTSTVDYLNDGFFSLSLLFGAVAITGLIALGAPVRWARAAAVGQLLVCTGVVAGLITGTSPTWFAVVAVPGLLTWLVSGVVLARWAWKAGLPRPLAVGIALLMPTTVVLAEVGGSAIAAVVWCALAARWSTVGRQISLEEPLRA